MPRARLWLAGIALATVASAAATVALAVIAAQIVAHAVTQPAWAMLHAAALLRAGVLAALVRAAADFTRRRAAVALALAARRAIRGRLLLRYGDLAPWGLAEQAPGALVATHLAGVDALAGLLSGYVPQALYAVLAPAVVASAVWWLYWPAGLVLTATAPLIPFFMVLIGRAAKALGARQWETLNRLQGHFLEAVEGLWTLVAFNLAERQTKVVARFSEEYRRVVSGTLRLAMLSALVLELGAAVATAMVAVTVGLALVAGRVAFAPALAVLVLAPEFYLPQRQLGAAFHQAESGLSAAGEVLALLDRPLAPAVGGGTHRYPGTAPPSMVVRDLEVRYPGQPRPVLAGINLVLAPGSTTVLTGASGAGKSTLLWCLLGLLAPTAGGIWVDGKALCHWDPESWRRHVAYLPQHLYFFPASIRDNLRLADPEADDRRLWAALAAASAEWVGALPDGLDTVVGEAGWQPSAGEAQRLALARVFLRDEARVVLLDEPTEHLDPITRAAVLPALARFLAGRTAVLVTHRREEMGLGQSRVDLKPLGGGGP